MLSTATTQTPPPAENRSRPFVVAKNLCKYYPISGFGHRVVKSVDDVSLTIGEGKCWASLVNPDAAKARLPG